MYLYSRGVVAVEGVPYTSVVTCTYCQTTQLKQDVNPPQQTALCSQKYTSNDSYGPCLEDAPEHAKVLGIHLTHALLSCFKTIFDCHTCSFMLQCTSEL